MTSFYDAYAEDFSKSRFRIWPLLKKFLDDLPTNSIVLDIGCGNGKNMVYRPDILMRGVEISETLCNICLSRGLTVIQGDARSLPFKDADFDAVIMIASIHHIPPEDHIQVLNEIKRVLKPNGKCLITNWAVEQAPESKRKFVPGLNMVVWKGKEDKPLPYWVMNKGQAEEFTRLLPSGLECVNLEWNGGNWYVLFEKKYAKTPNSP